uniref:CSON010819 protein n=1 Tax=Culicoides sonorensis TaxID=179676 RepID=A0A336M2Y7_CULSO
MISLKSVFFVFLVLFYTNHCTTQALGTELVKGVPILNIEEVAKSQPACQNENFLQCNAACDSLIVCQGINTDPILTQKCGAATPYCEVTGNEAACQATPGTTCRPSTSPTCTGAGYYPDVADCTKYNLCGGANSVPLFSYQCPTGYIYSSRDVACRRLIPCVRVTCPTTGAVLAPYTPNPEFYYLCQPNRTPIVYRCQENLQFRAGIGCSFVCPAEGIFKRDESSYYFCYRDGVLKYTIYTCPGGTVYDDTKKRCELQSTTAAPPTTPSDAEPTTTSTTTTTPATPELPFITNLHKMVHLQVIIFAVLVLILSVHNTIHAKECTNDNTLQCNSACDSLIVCDGAETDPLAEQKCGASTPFCESTGTTAVCQAERGANCPLKKYRCNSVGYIPDILNCSRYSLCLGVRTNPVASYECAEGLTYNSRTGVCEAYAFCSNNVCPEGESILAAYSGNPEYYYVCRPNAPISMYRCPIGLVFNEGVGCSLPAPPTTTAMPTTAAPTTTASATTTIANST